MRQRSLCQSPLVRRGLVLRRRAPCNDVCRPGQMSGGRFPVTPKLLRTLRREQWNYIASSGSTTLLGRPASTNTVLTATRRRRANPSGSPVFGLTSNFGKLLDDTSSRMRCPGRNRFAVGNSVMRISHHLAGLPQPRLRRVLRVAQPKDPVGQDHRVAARIVGGGRMHVDQLGGEVGIRPVGGDPQFGLDWSDHLHRLAQAAGSGTPARPAATPAAEKAAAQPKNPGPSTWSQLPA